MHILIAVGISEHGATAVSANSRRSISTGSCQAVAWGRLLAQLTGSTPTLLTVIKHESERPSAEAVIEKTAQELANGTAVPLARVVAGWVIEEIVREAQTGHYELLVMGLRPFPSIIQRFLGSVTERVLQQAPCPVLIAKSRPYGFHRILICEGGRDPTLLNRFICHLPEFIRDGTEIKILHVMSQILADPAEAGWELQADAQTLIEQHTPEGEMLQEDIRLLAVAPVPVATEVRHGLVVDEILTEAKNGRYDLIVIGRHQANGWWLADFTDEIVTQADRSVLVI